MRPKPLKPTLYVLYTPIIRRGLYNFYPIFHWGLYSKGANIADNTCTKQENSSKTSAFYNKEPF